MKLLLNLRGRDIYLVAPSGAHPAVYFIADADAGGILINTPPYDDALRSTLQAVAPLRYLFFPSRFGAHDVDRWRQASGAESLAYGAEVSAIAGTVDLALDNKNKLTRTIGFLPMSGRTAGSCALYLRNLPGAIFFGPILAPAASGWPTLTPQPDDHSYESRLFGALGLQDVKYDYAFTDVFVEGRTQFGPGADRAVQAELARVFE